MAYLLYLLFVCGIGSCTVSAKPKVSIIRSENPANLVQHGISALQSKLEVLDISYEIVNTLEGAEGKFILIAGLSEGSSDAAQLLQDSQGPKPDVPEALSIWKTTIKQKSAWVINGYDDRGLMYGLLDVAERITWSDTEDPFSELEPILEKPDVKTRAISLYTMNRRYWESRFYNEAYWASYMDLLVKNRFNSMVVIFGYENGGFLAPCYPYFFNVEQFPDVKMEVITSEEQQANLTALNNMVRMAHDRGLEFRLGIWDHIYRGGIQTGGISEEELKTHTSDHLVRGLYAENLNDYTRVALARFIQEVPDLDGIQLRVHNESGLKKGEEMENFWRDMFGMLKTTAPELQIDLRAKELPESIIKIASDVGLNFTIATKYWMEQLGLPFHPTHINRQNQFERRHGYADMLYYPKEYNIYWRLWSGGTQRVLLWGNPEYVRRLSASTHLHDGVGFEVNEPLATKMEAQAHDMEPFSLLNPPYVYYEYEFERYWHFFQLFGRLAYNPNTSTENWEREFQKRFGSEEGPIIQEALHTASNILPRIVAALSPYGKFPTTVAWAGKQRFGDLHAYSDAEGSDIQQFASFDFEAKLLIEGGETARRLPSSTSLWFSETHQKINQLLALLPPVDNKDENLELYVTVTDLKILSNLALFHSQRIPAAVSYRIYKRTNDPYALDDAIRSEQRARDAWQNVVEAAGDVYNSNLRMGVNELLYEDIKHHLSGHWSDELRYLDEGIKALQAEREGLPNTEIPRSSPAYKNAAAANYSDQFQIQHQAVGLAKVNQAIKIEVTITADADVRWARLRYRSVNQHLDYATMPLIAIDGSDVYEAIVPAEQIDPRFDFMYFIEVMNEEGNGIIYPDLEVETPYIIVPLDRH